jgi:hypothetical protein
MHHFRFLRKISIILCLVFVLFGCATRKNVIETSLSVTAKGTSEGILLHFHNIPDDTTDISLAFVDVKSNDRQETVVILNYNALNVVKETGFFLCPFAEKGREYFIRIYRLSGTEVVEKFVTGAIAGGGIYLTNNPLLHFANRNSTLALTEMPTFSEEVFFSQNGFFYFFTYLKMNDGNYFGVGGEATNSLNSLDSIRPKVETQEWIAKNFEIILTGYISMYGIVSCILDYGNIEWIIGLARSEDVLVLF